MFRKFTNKLREDADYYNKQFWTAKLGLLTVRETIVDFFFLLVKIYGGSKPIRIVFHNVKNNLILTFAAYLHLLRILTKM